MGRIFYLNESGSHITEKDIYDFFMSRINDSDICYNIGRASVYEGKGYSYTTNIYEDKYSRKYTVDDYDGHWNGEYHPAAEVVEFTQEEKDEEEEYYENKIKWIRECDYKVESERYKGRFLSYGDCFDLLSESSLETFKDLVFDYVEQEYNESGYDRDSFDDFLDALDYIGYDYLKDKNGNYIALIRWD